MTQQEIAFQLGVNQGRVKEVVQHAGPRLPLLRVRSRAIRSSGHEVRRSCRLRTFSTRPLADASRTISDDLECWSVGPSPEEAGLSASSASAGPQDQLSLTRSNRSSCDRIRP
jgi:hypothetical protein